MSIMLKKITSLTLAMATMFAVATGCDKKVDLTVNAPDYSNSTAQFMTYGYQAIMDDWYAVDGIRTYLDTSLLTKENIEIYKEAGLNTLFISWVASYNGSETKPSWATSKTKQVMDWAYELDMDVFVFNSNLSALTSLTSSLFVENPDDANNRTTFASEESLDAYVRDSIGAVMSHPACIGVSLNDEPNWKMLPQYGAVYRSVKRCYPNAYVMMNMLPYSPGSGHLNGIEKSYCENYLSMTSEQAYLKYLQDYLDYTGADYLQYDDYPIRGNNTDNAFVLASTLKGAQLAADFCKENNLELHKVFQTCSFKTGSWVCRAPDVDDMYWQLNVGMAMGIKGYSYWTYFPTVNTNGEYYLEDACFVNREGEPNPIYYTMQTLHSELQEMAKVLSHFDYQALRTYTKAPIPGSVGFLSGVIDSDLQYITNVELEEGGVVLVSELYDSANNQYGYYIVNTSDSAVAEEATQTLEISIKDFEKIQIYNMGNIENVALNNGKYTVTLECGRGIFVLPY